MKFPILWWCLFSLLPVSFAGGMVLTNGAYQVYPGDRIQEALDAAANNASVKHVRVHPGIYRPSAPGQAFIWLNARHDGVHLEAEGDVILTAANPLVSDPKSPSHPAIVNHVVYFGTGISSNTLLKGFKITGANNFVTKNRTREIEPNSRLTKGVYFYTDGGAIKIFGQSYPTLESLEMVDNYSDPCAGGISIEHLAMRVNTNHFVRIRNCVFRNNRALQTGAALDLLWGSAAVVQNCLFVENASNLGEDYISLAEHRVPFTNNGVLTVFENSWIIVENCTFSGNRNGVDDRARGNVYRDCIFWENVLDCGLPGKRFELDLTDGSRVSGCHIFGGIPDLKNTLSMDRNNFSKEPPDFRSDFTPRSSNDAGRGYRPAP